MIFLRLLLQWEKEEGEKWVLEVVLFFFDETFVECGVN